MDSSWQLYAVAAVEIAAVVYLAWRFFGRARSAPRRAPQVPVSALVRKRR